MDVEVKNIFPEHIIALKYLLILDLLFCFASGGVIIFAVNRPIAFQQDFGMILVKGLTFGIFAFLLPQVVTAALAKVFKKKAKLKHFFFISFVAEVFYVAFLMVWLLFSKFVQNSLVIFAAIGNAIAIVVWYLGLKAISKTKKIDAVFLFLHPSLNVIGLMLVGNMLFVSVSPVMILKLYLGIVVYFVFLNVVIYLLNAPMKRNFGVSTIDLTLGFFGSRISREDIFGGLIEKIGEKVTINLDMVVFRTKNGIKTTFVVPQVHFGPFGETGGSEYPYLLGNEKRLVFHSLTSNNFNPIFRNDYRKLKEEIEKTEEEVKSRPFKWLPSAVYSVALKERAFTLKSGDDYMFVLTRAPFVTEDFSEGAGASIKEYAKSLGARSAVFADAHNSREKGEEGGMVKLGSSIYENYKKVVERAIEKGKEVKEAKMKMGFGAVNTKESSDLGKGGIKAVVMELDGAKKGIIVIDGNNMLPRLRSEILEFVKDEFGVECEVATTDTHYVQKSGQKEIFVGQYTNDEYLKKKISEAIATAITNMEPVTPVFVEKKIQNFLVWGEGKANEIVATINSVAVLLEFVAPALALLGMFIVGMIIWAI